jgi:hypothetical protein
MLRVHARASGWLVKKIGVEALFAKREGAMRVICQSDTPTHWVMRTLPDMALRSRSITAIVEAKSMISTTSNASVEAVQLCLLAAWSKMGIPIHYCFGRPGPDGYLKAKVLLLSSIKPCFIGLTPRSQSFGLQLQRFSERLFPEAEVGFVGITQGSNTPYALIPLVEIESQGCNLMAWLQTNGGGEPFGMKEREAWEGRKESRAVWPPIDYQRWTQMWKKKYGG